MAEQGIENEDFSNPLSMHLCFNGAARVSVGLGNDGTVRLFWRQRDGLTFEPDIQEVRFVDGKWVATGQRGPCLPQDGGGNPQVTGFK